MKHIFLLFLTLSNSILSQTVNELYTNANSLYKEGKYKEALKLYEQIEAKDNVSSELYYNMGNCCYKLNKVASTIYNYEKALQLNSSNDDARNNLVFAKRLTLDRIESLPKSIFQKLDERYIQIMSYNSWAAISVFFSFMTATLFLLFYFSTIPFRKRLFFITSVISFLVLTICLVITYNQYNTRKNTREAIIFAKEIAVKNGPTNNSDSAFTVHEGLKVQLLDTVDSWRKIQLTDGKTGWLPTKDLKEI